MTHHLLIIYSLFIFVAGCQSPQNSILARISKNLEQTRHLACFYSFKQEIENMPEANWTAEGLMAFDFSKENALLANIYIDRAGERGFKRLFVRDTLVDIKPEISTIVKTASTDRNWLYGHLTLYFSPFEIKEVLPAIVNDSTTKILQVKDTTIVANKAIHIQIELEKSIIAGKLVKTENSKNRFNLSVRKKDLLPLEWEVVLENGNIKTSFTHLSTTVPDSTWKISGQQKQYLVLSGEEYSLRDQINLSAQTGQEMINWKLPSIDGDTVTNYSFKKKLILYEFFFVGCGGSIKAKPYIDSLSREFSDHLQVVNIEVQGFTREEVQSFADRFHLSTPTLYSGKELANQLGVKGCPTFILVDDLGTIVHAAFGQVETLKLLIEERLKEI